MNKEDLQYKLRNRICPKCNKTLRQDFTFREINKIKLICPNCKNEIITYKEWFQ